MLLQNKDIINENSTSNIDFEHFTLSIASTFICNVLSAPVGCRVMVSIFTAIAKGTVLT